MRNPWGHHESWNGRFKPNSNDWDMVAKNIKDYLNVNEQTNGQFIISYDDFFNYFDQLDFVHVNLNAFSNSLCNHPPVKWITKQIYGAFIPGLNAGGLNF
jgi:hypothetical protein